MPDTNNDPERFLNRQAAWQSPIGRQLFASAGLALAGTGIPFAEQRVNCGTTNN
ncbi:MULTISPECIES: hypothetical protein [Mesorhizobium]|uniref:hypothetical protein n=1 Tax=Mesorhizobium TaxID=68287 RepID=UPI00142D30CD|nr:MULTISPECIES: hypothetical protein [Mesorhizobium]